ncbi:MAG: hypothetical protein KOO60_04520 [Gemmatimonadales bacterium]|nr:hypothetical protein [Gemmatimonadales bacterium]
MKTLLNSILMALLISLLAVGAYAQSENAQSAQDPQGEPDVVPGGDTTTTRTDEFDGVDNTGTQDGVVLRNLERFGPPSGVVPVTSDLDKAFGEDSVVEGEMIGSNRGLGQDTGQPREGEALENVGDDYFGSPLEDNEGEADQQQRTGRIK